MLEEGFVYRRNRFFFRLTGLPLKGETNAWWGKRAFSFCVVSIQRKGDRDTSRGGNFVKIVFALFCKWMFSKRKQVILE